jgi:hypothetical protein
VAKASPGNHARGRAAVVLSVLAVFGCLSAGWPDGARADLLVPNPGPRSTSIGVYRSDTTEFFGRSSRPGFEDDRFGGFHFAFGNRGDVPVVGDWDGNGSQTQGVFRAGIWSLANTLGRGGDWPVATTLGNLYGAYAVRFGQRGDRPLVGDWDGNGRQTIGVQRGNLFLLSDNNLAPAATYAFRYGEVGDVAVVGDWDGDGVDTIGVYRSGVWHLRNSNSGGAADLEVAYGGSASVPIVGDWDADGRVGLGLFDRGGWHLSNSVASPATDVYVPFGNATDRPLVGNWGSTSQMFGDSPASLSNFFPLAVDFQPPSLFGRWKKRGVNTVIRVPVGTDTGRWTDAANALGLKMIRAPRVNPEVDNVEPNLLAFAGPDEPDLTGCDPDCVRKQYRRLKAAAPSKPYLVNLAGSSVVSQFPPSDPQSCNGPGDWQGDAACITRYVGATDWVSHDVYPANAGLPLATIGDALDRLRRWSDRRPQFAYIEAADYDGDGRGPTPDQFRGEIWEAIIHGARGISYFVVDANHPTERPDAVPPGIVTEMRSENARITQLTHVLQATINPSSMSVKAKPPIEYTWRRVGSTTYLIALNQSAVPVEGASMKVLGVNVPSTITVWEEGRTLASSGNALTDSFGAYEVHVYRF